jgi:hypothetical protein
MLSMSTKSRQVIYGGQIIGAKIRADGARKHAAKAIRETDRAEAESVVDPDGGLWRASAALPDHRPMPQWRIRLARSRVPPLQGPREPNARCDPASAKHPDLEAGSGAEMPVMQERAIRTARPHDQADDGA